MTCADYRREIAELAPARRWPANGLSTHLKNCAACSENWEARMNLVRHMDFLRQEAGARAAAPQARREELLRRFAEQYPRRSAVRVQRWGWAVAMAAALTMAVAVGPKALESWRTADAVVAEESVDVQDGFIAVPYAAALAAGESLRVVRTELYPAALASLGVDIDPAWTGTMPADLLVGEDGYPRAVRVSAETDDSGN